jgi:replicative DNA helicase
MVHEVILDLYGRGEPADAVTVAAELTKRGDIGRMGGAPYLHTLIASVPTAANAGYYARIVRERALLRRLVEVGTRIVQLGYSGDGDADDLVDRAEAEVYGVTERRVSDDYLQLSDIMPGALNEIEAIGSRGGALTGVPTGFADLDSLTNGLHPGQMIVIAARPALGKALALDTPLPTPDGWTTMGAVQVGDYLIGADGTPTRVLAATDVLHGRPCFEVEFDDGTVITADAEHQWRTTTRASRRQHGENRTSWHWPEESRRRLRGACATALREPDRCVTAAEVLAEAGAEFRAVMHAAGLGVGLANQRIPVKVTGPKRSYTWHAPAYSSRHALLTAMTRRADQPMNAATTAAHSDIVTTAEMAATVRMASDGRQNHAVAVAQAAVLPARDLPFPPYTLGAWLGDGTSRSAHITTADPEIIAEIEADGFHVAKSPAAYLRYVIRLPRRPAVPERPCAVCGKPFTPKTSQVRTCGKVCGGASRSGRWRSILGPSPRPVCPDCGQPSSGAELCRACRDHHGSAQAILRSMGVLGNKHIPAEYLRASEAQRRALLAGLMDTDGHAFKNGTVQLAVTSQRLAEGALELVLSLGYRASMATKPVKGRTADTSTCYMITFTPSRKVFRLERKLARQTTRAYPTTRCRFVSDVRPVASVPVRCVQVDSADQMYLASQAWIPTHNSTLALDLARAASVRHGLTSVIFSLEMSRNEITMRLLSAEARVPLHSMRTGQMGDEDWTRLARRMSEVVNAPLFIDDSPNMSMMEIRAKCRRLKQRHDLRLVIIDYLQLMSSPKRVENRQQEVSDMSRSLKLLAKELNVPVIAVAQLNRGPEQRTDKRPLLADLRESGCLTADTTLMRADTGAPITLRELLDNGHDGVLVWSVDQQHRIVPAPVIDVFPSGTKEVYRLKLASGREVKASGNHPFLTFAGWLPVEELAAGDRVAIPRRIPSPVSAGLGWTEGRLGLLAHLIGDGCVLRSQPVHYTSNDEANLDFVESAAAVEFGITPRRVAQNTWWRSHLPAPYHCTLGRYNPLHIWFRELGIENLRSYEKRIPAVLYSANDKEIALFLRHLWATHGCIWNPHGQSTPKAYYASTSRQLADGVAVLLARLGIVARIRTVAKEGYRPSYHVIIADGPSLRAFCAEVGVHGRRERLLRCAEALGSPLLEAAGTSDIYWDRIESIEPLGPCPVFDATVKGTHNFIADGIFAHNSIEQDSDVVILLHREDAYERESPRAGEADFIVAKHRNGPTATVTVAFQGHFSRFVDMASG